MNIEELSKSVFRLSYKDTSSEDYVYFQILNYLAEHGTFTVSELDRKILFKKEPESEEIFKIERRKLKNIIHGTDKNYEGLIPLNYITTTLPSKYRGGYPETNYYLTEKGLMASLGFYSYKKNINIKNILKLYDKMYGKPFSKFASEFLKLQIEIFLLYHHLQGITLGFNHDYDDYYNEFRKIIVQPFSIRISRNSTLEKQFYELLQKFNLYRKIHSKFLKDNILLNQVWKEPHGKKIPSHGFEGWYRTSLLVTALTKKEKSNSTHMRTRLVHRRDKPKLVRDYIYIQFQTYSNKVSQTSIEREMKLLGIKKLSTTRFNSQSLASEKLNYEKKFQNNS